MSSKNYLRPVLVACMALACVPLSACHRSGVSTDGAQAAVAEPATAKDKAAADADEGIALNADEIAALGLATTEARVIRSAPEVQGFGSVMPHDAIAQAVADLRIASAGVRQSRAARERVQQLAQTPGAMPGDALELAERQADADLAALALATQRLSAVLGEDSPLRAGGDADLVALADGRYKLIRVTLSADASVTETPRNVRVARMGSAQGGRSWLLPAMWRAPADAATPGNSFFGLLRNREIGEGEHLMAWAPVGAADSGVLVPAAAAVVTGGKFYCYVEKKPGSYVRTQFDAGRPVPQGYFVGEGIEAGEKIVTAGAGQLLAREMNPDKEAE